MNRKISPSIVQESSLLIERSIIMSIIKMMKRNDVEYYVAEVALLILCLSLMNRNVVMSYYAVLLLCERITVV